MTHIARIALAAGIAASLSGFAAAAEHLPPGLPASAVLLLRYDVNHDGIITREEMEAGLKAEFEAADTNGDGCLDPAEVRAENDRRLKRDGAQASPLVDWNLDGCVDQKEFGNTVRSYFDLVDKTRNGQVTLLELHGSAIPIPPREESKPKPDADSGSGSGSDTPGGAASSRTPGPSGY